MLDSDRKTFCCENMESKKYLDISKACFWNSICKTVHMLTIVTEGQNATTPAKTPLEEGKDCQKVLITCLINA